MSKKEAILNIRVKVIPVDPAYEDPDEIAEYFLDKNCDDPTFVFLGAMWEPV